MPVPRRNFMKLLGISLGSLLLARCQRSEILEPTIVMCYAAIPLTPTPGTPTPGIPTARDRLRLCWLRFGELAQKTADARNSGDGSSDHNPLGVQMNADHRAALDALVGAGEIPAPAADLIQEAFSAAVYHVWRSNAPMTCYEPMRIDFQPASAGNLVRQSEILGRIAAGSTIAPDTLEKVRAALEHDMAYYALSDADVDALYEKLLEQYGSAGKTLPSYEAVELTLTPEARQAAQFLVDVLMGK